MSMDTVNSLILETLDALLSQYDMETSIVYADPSQVQLKQLVVFAGIREFQFPDMVTGDGKRKIALWIKARQDNVPVRPRKLYGFIAFIMQYAGSRPGIAECVEQLLILPEVEDAVKKTKGSTDQLIQWRIQLKEWIALSPELRDQYLAFQQGVAPIVDNWGMYRHRHTITINANGTGDHYIEATVANLHRLPLVHMYCPIFTSIALDESELQPWSETNTGESTIRIYVWKDNAGAVEIEFNPVIPYHESRAFTWGYHTPHLFSVGREFYNFGVDGPTGYFEALLQFDPAWQIQNVISTGSGILAHDESTISLKAYFPKMGTTQQILFDLDRDNF